MVEQRGVDGEGHLSQGSIEGSQGVVLNRALTSAVLSVPSLSSNHDGDICTEGSQRTRGRGFCVANGETVSNLGLSFVICKMARWDPIISKVPFQ
jgi:hypothetical protein